MSTTGWRKNTSVIQQLTDKPYNYSFFQAVRLLERSSALAEKSDKKLANKPVARFTPPNTEVVRFYSHQSLGFPASEVFKINHNGKKSNSNQWNLTVNFMGLTGAKGTLPVHYSEMILQRQKMKDASLTNFLNLFNHRTVSLFYQAALKYKLPIEYERKKLNPPEKGERDTHTQALLSLVGLGTKHLMDRFYTRDESLLYYSGLLSQQLRTTTGLKQILQDHFNIPVEIKEFNGQWQELINDVRTRLPGIEAPKGQNNCLGRSVMLGKQGWFAQGKIRIILGPLNKKQLNTFAPGTRALMSLNEIAGLYIGMEHNYDFTIRVKRSDIPQKIQLNSKNPPVISWNTWLSTKNRTFSPDETVDISVSAQRFNTL